jgi:ABC-type branched-subunit amino acid transport system substrate-binding protein
MKPHTRSQLIAFLALLFSLHLAAIAWAQPPEIKLGGIFDLSSGAGSVWGTTERDAFLMAVEDFQKEHNIQVTTYLEDSAYSPTKSVSALQKMISVNGVRFVVGPTWETFVATMPVCEQRKIICFAPSNNGEPFHDPQKTLHYSFSAYYDERDYGRVLAQKFMADKLKNYAVFSAESAYYQTVWKGFQEVVKQAPLNLERFSPQTTDFYSMIAKLPKDIGSLLLLLDGNGQHQAFLEQWRQRRADSPLILASDGVAYEPKLSEIQKMGFQIFYSLPFMEPDIEAKWNDKYRARFGKDPAAPSGSIAYDEARLLLECINSAQNSAETVARCIAKTDSYQGLSGNISFRGGQTVLNRKFSVKQVGNSPYSR